MANSPYDMSVIVFDARVLPLLARNEAWWLWSSDAQKLLLTNKMGATLMGASGISMALARTYSSSHRFAGQIAKIATSLEEKSEPRLERLQVQTKFVSSTQVFQALRLVFADGSIGILIKSALGAADNAACVEFIENAPFPIWGFTLEGEPVAASDKGLTLAKSSLKLLLGSAARQTLTQLDERASSKIMLTSGELSLIIPPDYEMIIALLVEGKNGLSSLTPTSKGGPRLVVTNTPPNIENDSDNILENEDEDEDDFLSQVFIEEEDDESAIAQGFMPEDADLLGIEEDFTYKIIDISESDSFENDEVEISGELLSQLPPPRFDIERKVRFVWQTDAAHRFISVSHEFEEIVGAKNAQILHKTWDELQELYSLKVDVALSDAFKGRDTWSGYSVEWPIEGQSARAVIDFAALPVFDRVRGFTGFRGFGVIKDYVGLPTKSIPPVKLAPLLKPQEAKAFHEIGVALGGKETAPEAPKLSKTQLNDTALLDKLPLGVVIYHGNRIHFANAHLLEWSGFISREQLEQQGGMARLFAGAQLEATTDSLSITTSEGKIIPVTARLVATKWAGESALAMILSEKPAPPVKAPPSSIEAEALLESTLILDKACDGFALLDPFLTLTHLNKGALKLFNKEEEELLNTPFASHFEALSQEKINNYFSFDEFERGQEVVLNNVYFHLTMVKLPRHEGICYAAILRNLTQWQQAKDELTAAKLKAEEASAQKSIFLARVSHEIRTPLNAILGFSEVMREEHFGPIGNERYKDYLQDISTSGNHVLSLINDLLDLAKVESGKLTLDIKQLDLNSNIIDTLTLLQEEARRARVIIRTSLAPQLPQVLFDKRSLTQILLNLLGNSLKFTPAGGQIILSTALNENGAVLMRVRDTGIGMSESELQEALEPFKQTGAAQNKGGTGLGLPLTKALVLANGGEFNISSRTKEGTLVEVTLKN